uniref:Guanine nucleotide-binding protein-like 1 n=1 Tax=Hirondellea gigas TaxID=1518452 RepID=A0A2P2HZ94_9CRUS
MGQFQRRKPFSSKQKKAQLKFKFQRRNGAGFDESQAGCKVGVTSTGSTSKPVMPSAAVPALPSGNMYSVYTREVVSINKQPQQPGRSGRDDRFNLEFSRAKLDAEFERGKKEMYEEVTTAEPATLEYRSEDFFPPGLTFPQRPKGYQSMSKEQLNTLETKSVRLYGEEIEKLFRGAEINLYEQNVETWKQLWRVFDKSHVLLFIVDMRFAVCQFPAYVYHALREQGRGVVLVLNKVDLVPASLVLAWRRYFTTAYPHLQVVAFCSHERVADRTRRTKTALNSCRSLIDAVQAVAPQHVDLSSWRQQLETEVLHLNDNLQYSRSNNNENNESDQSDDDGDGNLGRGGGYQQQKQYRGKIRYELDNPKQENSAQQSSRRKQKQKHKRRGKHRQVEFFDDSDVESCDEDSDGVVDSRSHEAVAEDTEVSHADATEGDDDLTADGKTLPRTFTIGTIGYPNVGKSSLINAIMGRYMVSVSQTPGHTKHFQTHFLTPSRDLLLCDCPGLIFPAICPYNLQVLSGTFPISQVRIPMSVVGFLASHINVPRALGVTFPAEYQQDFEDRAAHWTPYIISEAWAKKRNYHVKGKGGRLDCSRAANELLRLSLAAKNKLVFSLRPQGYTRNKSELERQHADIRSIQLTQGVHATEAVVQERVLSFQRIPRGADLSTLLEETQLSDGHASQQQKSCDTDEDDNLNSDLDESDSGTNEFRSACESSDGIEN